MSMTRWAPFRNITTLQDRINKVFEESMDRNREYEDGNMVMCAWKPPVDIFETADGIMIRAEIPGVNKEDVSVEVKDNILTLRGERRPDSGVEEKHFFRRERVHGKFHRAFTMRDLVDPDSIRAKITDGVLEVEVPNPEEDKPRQIKVNIE